MSRLMRCALKALLAGAMTVSTLASAEQCPSVSLDQPFIELKARFESLVPINSFVTHGHTCIEDFDIVSVNYSPICSVNGKADVVLASAFGSARGKRLTRITLHIPYVEGIAKEIQSYLGSNQIPMTEVANQYSAATVEESRLFALDSGKTNALLTVEQGMLALDGKKFFVIRSFPSNDDGTQMKALLSCIN